MPTEPDARKRLAALMEEPRLGLRKTWQQVATDSGISLKALHSARSGPSDIRALTRRGIDKGLQWEPGSVDLILDGGDPVPTQPEQPMPGVCSAVASTRTSSPRRKPKSARPRHGPTRTDRAAARSSPARTGSPARGTTSG
jgi:hypothetical protein